MAGRKKTKMLSFLGTGTLGLFLVFSAAYAQEEILGNTEPKTIPNLSSLGKFVQSTDAEIESGLQRKVYLSPNRKYIAVSESFYEQPVITSIKTIEGNAVTKTVIGSFRSWAPDSSKVLLYVSNARSDEGRKLYSLDIKGEVTDLGLPSETTGADISPVDGSIVYTVTEEGSDATYLFVRNPDGRDELILKGDKIYAWPRWSPDGQLVALLESDQYMHPGKQNLILIDLKNMDREQISKVAWNFAPSWSPDGAKIAFSNEGNIWEYSLSSNSLENISNFNRGVSEHPTYSEDGTVIVFSSDVTGKKQIWAVRGNEKLQLTEQQIGKDYPVIIEYE
ncbi:MAG TPA: DPP IV N-terminal domain-containing protein [Candidatus Paceibacterota bacterium]|nr:DPP IV N-terminal domain-containing protein [Candidatus Paceibacterota bacterium]